MDMSREEEELVGTWRIDGGTLQLDADGLHVEYVKESVDVAIPGYDGELQGLSWKSGSAKFFAYGFDLADDSEMERAMNQILLGD